MKNNLKLKLIIFVIFALLLVNLGNSIDNIRLSAGEHVSDVCSDEAAVFSFTLTNSGSIREVYHISVDNIYSTLSNELSILEPAEQETIYLFINTPNSVLGQQNAVITITAENTLQQLNRDISYRIINCELVSSTLTTGSASDSSDSSLSSRINDYVDKSGITFSSSDSSDLVSGSDSSTDSDKKKKIILVVIIFGAIILLLLLLLLIMLIFSDDPDDSFVISESKGEYFLGEPMPAGQKRQQIRTMYKPNYVKVDFQEKSSPLSFEGELTSFYKADINLVNDVDAVEIRSKDGRAGAKKLKNAYNYFHFKRNNITDYDVRSAAIYFKVEKIYLSANELNQSDIVLKRYDALGKAWQNLPTTRIKSDEIFAYYRAESPTLDRFAVTPKFELIKAKPSKLVKPDVEKKQSKKSKLAAIPTDDQPRKRKWLIPLIILIILLLLVGLFLGLYFGTDLFKGSGSSSADDIIITSANTLNDSSASDTTPLYKELNQSDSADLDEEMAKYQQEILDKYYGDSSDVDSTASADSSSESSTITTNNVKTSKSLQDEYDDYVNDPKAFFNTDAYEPIQDFNGVRVALEKDPFCVNNNPLRCHVWDMNTPYTFDLNDFIIDEDGDLLLYTASYVKNIKVSISRGVVKLFPDPDYVGVRHLDITVDDGVDKLQTGEITLVVKNPNASFE